MTDRRSHSLASSLPTLMALPILGGLLAISAACGDGGVGDPYTPEVVPEGDFNASEISIETGSPQCRTRVGMVYRFDGNPSRIQGEDPACEGDPTCFTQEQVDRCVYCSCRCKNPPGVSASTCSCPSGFTCLENVIEVGGDGIRGGYCVREDTADLDRCN